MTTYLIRRVIQAIPTIIGITLISFILIMLAPGDPLTRFALNPEASPESMERLRRQMGLDKPILEQYLYWMIGNDWTTIDVDGDGVGDIQGTRQGLLRGDMGQSFQHRRPVLELILERIPATLQLTLPPLLIGYGLGIVLGTLAAANKGSLLDQAVRILSVLGTALPNFWLGLILIILFSVKLQVLPIGGMRDLTRTDGSVDVMDTLVHMILPVSVLALGIIASVTRYMRASVLEVIEQDYVRTARSKGLSGRRIFNVHVMRNALLPIATLFGPGLAALLSGAVIIEQVFSWPGMGRLTITAIFQRDFPLIMGSVLISAILYVIGLIISDVLYALLDPRIRF
ncbi:ABC transporter permease [Phototrophicus methaneseepsis]|uniref:ABC transporter permease n=1 Tax=Phototrophicus methaneseepsis TaxID=2710758 RepID=A0A7S8ED99_9CHLR|nr:ABC transporter permease [Phototrophicus methaneseepsis]QPC84623.1 ABC transporter permease [Phototrophicus methaneseepsis]